MNVGAPFDCGFAVLRFMGTAKTGIKTRVGSLLTWYARHARALPWRRTTDPYAIWISEVMLQQTQVKTVQPYWKRWMQRFPDVRSLAKAKPEQVLKLWEGLGYYGRARNVHQAAQIIVAKHHGLFPASYSEIHALPGIGRYTAGAICSIAFNQPVPVLDGNVMRVLTRVFGIRENPRQNETNENLWALAEKMVARAAREPPASARNCSNFNQALMELGATVCTPRQPKCPACPWQKSCLARRTGQTEAIPNLDSRNGTVRRRVVAFAVTDSGRVLVRQRPAGVVNAHLWEFPNQEITDLRASLSKLARQCLGFRVQSLMPLCRIKHTITRYRIELVVYRGTVRGGSSAKIGASRWCEFTELDALAFPSAHRRIVRALKATDAARPFA